MVLLIRYAFGVVLVAKQLRFKLAQYYRSEDYIVDLCPISVFFVNKGRLHCTIILKLFGGIPVQKIYRYQ